MESIGNWIVALNKTNHVGFGMLTVVTMSGLGVVIAATIEVLFKIIGIKGERIEIHH